MVKRHSAKYNWAKDICKNDFVYYVERLFRQCLAKI